MINNRFIIIVPVYNSEKYIGQCLSSILTQDYENYKLIIVNDGSTDDTDKIITFIRKKHNKNFIVYKSETHLGSPLGSFVEGVKIASDDDEDILVTVDGDDWLYGTDVFSHLNRHYQNQNICLTYGQYEPASKTYRDYCKPLENTQKYRKNEKWTTSHLRTFKKKIFNLIKDEDLRGKNGQYYKAAGDAALMYPAIELCGPKRIMFISKLLYIYNDLNPANEMKIHQHENLKIAKNIRNKPTYTQLESLPSDNPERNYFRSSCLQTSAL